MTLSYRQEIIAVPDALPSRTARVAVYSGLLAIILSCLIVYYSTADLKTVSPNSPAIVFPICLSVGIIVLAFSNFLPLLILDRPRLRPTKDDISDIQRRLNDAIQYARHVTGHGGLELEYYIQAKARGRSHSDVALYEMRISNKTGSVPEDLMDLAVRKFEPSLRKCLQGKSLAKDWIPGGGINMRPSYIQLRGKVENDGITFFYGNTKELRKLSGHELMALIEEVDRIAD